MAAKYILAVLSLIFLGFAAARLLRDRTLAQSAAKTWLMVGVIFGLVSAYLWVFV
jgi:hypothetical protein